MKMRRGWWSGGEKSSYGGWRWRNGFVMVVEGGGVGLLWWLEVVVRDEKVS
jgi:hypothetical protein